MKLFMIIAVLTLMAGCTPVEQPPASSVAAEKIQWLRDFSQAQQMAAASEKPVLIDFYTDWCGWCKKLDKETFVDAAVVEASKEFVCVKINGDDRRDLVRQFNVNGFPSTVFLRSDATVIEVVPGFFPPREYAALMERIAAQVR